MGFTNHETDALISRKMNKVLPAFSASVIACQLSFIAGICQGYSAILIAQLEESDSPIQITKDEASWIASFGTVCRPLGALVEGYIVDKYGRKPTMLLVSALISFAWLLTFFARTVMMLYISRILLSFALGMVICVGLYIAEISRPTERGTLLSLITPCTMGGTLFVYVLGYLYPWKTVALILCLYCLAIFCLMFIIPETHIWYMLNWRKPNAMVSLMWLRRDAAVVQLEIADAEERVKNMEKTGNYLQHFRDPAVWKPFLILTVFSLLQQQVGYNIITYYAVDFFKSFETSYNGNVLSIWFAALSTVGSLLLMTVVHKFYRKTLLCASGIGMSVFMALGAISLSIKDDPDIVPVVCVFIYILFCMLGMIDIPWMIVGEMFPTKVRGSLSAITTVVIFSMQFVTLKTYPYLSSALGVSGLFWYFAILSLLTVIFAKIFFPETKDKSLFEIEERFRK